MNIVISLLRYVCLFVTVFILSVVLGNFSWEIFNHFIPQQGGSFVEMDFSGVAGSILAYTFLAPLFAFLFGEKHWIWSVVVFALPIVALELLSGPSYLGLLVVLFLAGLAAGYALRILASITLGKLPQFAGWKKYF